MADRPFRSRSGPALVTVVPGFSRSGWPGPVRSCSLTDSREPAFAWEASQASSAPMACTAQSPAGRVPPGVPADTTRPCGSTTTWRAGPELGAGGSGAPNCGVKTTTSFDPEQTVFCRGSSVGAKPATPQSSATPGSRLTPRTRVDEPSAARSAADDDTFRTRSRFWPSKTAAARSPSASDSTTPFCADSPVSTPPTKLTAGASIVKKPPFVAATEPSAADAACAVVRLAMAGPCEANTRPSNFRGSMTATCTSSASGAGAGSKPVHSTSGANPSAVSSEATGPASAWVANCPTRTRTPITPCGSSV